MYSSQCPDNWSSHKRVNPKTNIETVFHFTCYGICFILFRISSPNSVHTTDSSHISLTDQPKLGYGMHIRCIQFHSTHQMVIYVWIISFTGCCCQYWNDWNICGNGGHENAWQKKTLPHRIARD